MFFRFIAILFLLLFFVKLINPKVIPYFKETWAFIKDLFFTTLRLFTRSFASAFQLLLQRTVYVVGIDLLSALAILFIVYFYVYFPSYPIAGLWLVFKNHFFDLYILTFFAGSYIIGMVELLKQGGTIDWQKTFNKIFFARSVRMPFRERQEGTEDSHYVYDETTGEYKYVKKDRDA